MRKFILYITVALFSYLLLLECTTRIFDLSGHTIPKVNLNDNILSTPKSEGIWVKGGMREISSHYKINGQGFNSIKDYSNVDEDKISIAIIGDSYIEGLHVDVENSIGRVLEGETQNSVEVHEYGASGGNIVDFSIMFKEFVRNKYDYTFILVTNEDIIATQSAVMRKGKNVTQKTAIREVYNRLSFIRYLNINHGLKTKLKQILSFSNSADEKEKGISNKDVNISALKEFDDTCVFLYENEKLDIQLINSLIELSSVEVVHQFTPYTYGFDSHWNSQGRKNCVFSIKNFLEGERLL